MRHGASWSDACILNVSTHGLLIHTSRNTPVGGQVELWRGENVIAARVVWHSGAKAGLRTDDPVPVEQILTLGQSQSLQLGVGRGRGERRKAPRLEDRHRLRGKAIEFVSVVVIGASLAGAAVIMVEEAFVRPLALVQQSLGALDQPPTVSR